MPSFGMIRGLAKNLAGYGAAPTSARTPSFIGANTPDDPYGPSAPPPDDADSDPGGGNDVAPPQQPQPLPLNRLDQPPPKAADLAPPPARVMTAREKLAQMNDPDALPKTSVKRQLGAAALSLIPGVNMTDIPRNVAYPGISDYTRRRQVLQQQVALEHQGTQEDLTRLQRDTQRENVESLRETRSGNMQTRQSDERRKEAADVSRVGGVPINDANLPAGMAPLLSPEDEGKYFTKQINGQWYKVPTPEERQRLALEAKGQEMIDVPADLQDLLGPKATRDQISRASKARRPPSPLSPTTRAGLIAIGAKDVNSPTPDELNQGAAWTLKQRPAGKGKSAAGPVTPRPQPVGPGGAPLTGDAFLSTLDPGTAASVKAYAEGRDSKAPRGGKELMAFKALVNQYDPNFSDMRAQIRRTFTSGPEAKNIGALNTASVHLDQLDEAAKAMKNGSFVPGNQAYNYISRMFGSNAVTNFGNLKSAVAGELANALKGVATDIEIKNISENIMAANSPEQMAGAVDTNLHTLGAKLKTYQERYQQQIPNDTAWSPVLPSARKVYQKHGFDPVQGGNQGTGGTVNMKAPDGSLKPVPADQVDHYKKLGAVVVQ